MGQPIAYWPKEDGDGNVMPLEITDEQKRTLPPCRPGWHAPDDDGRECRVCGRTLAAADRPITIQIPPGAVDPLMRVLADGARAAGAVTEPGKRFEAKIDDLAIAA